MSKQNDDNGAPSQQLRKSKRLLSKQAKLKCPICQCTVEDNDRAVCCDKCDVWYHENCIGISIDLLENIPWYCNKCAHDMEELLKHKNIPESQQPEGNVPETRSNHGTNSRKSNTTQRTSLSTIKRQNFELQRLRELEEAEIELTRVAMKAKADAIKEKADAEIAAVMEIMKIKSRYAQQQKEVMLSRSSNASSTCDRDYVNDKNNRTEAWIKNVQSSENRNNGVANDASEYVAFNNITQSKNLGVEKTRRNTASKNIIESPHATCQNCEPVLHRTKEKLFNMQLPVSHERKPPAATKYESTFAYKYTDDANVELSNQQLVIRQALERVELPYFDGNPIEWPLFITSYNMSSTRCGYTDVENLIRLKKALRGKALEAVMGRLFLPSQVSSVIERLGELFGRPMKILSGIKDKVRNLPTIGEDEMEGIIQMSLEVDQLCGTIEATTQTEHLYNPDLQYQLIEKLPGHLRLRWAEYCDGIDSVNLNTFREWLIEVSRYASRVVEGQSITLQQQHRSKAPAPISNKQRRSNGKHMLATHDNRNTTASTSTPTAESNSMKLCKVCEKDAHTVEQCTSFKNMSTSERWKVVMSKGICGRCLGYHKFFKCPEKTKSCLEDGCQRNHHKMLHKLNSTATNVHVSTNMQHHQMSQKVYFRIIPVTLHNGTKSIPTYAFLDEGSSVTLIDAKFANDLKLTGPSRELCLTWTKDVQRVEENSRCVSVKISGKGTRKFQMNDIYTVTNLKLPTQTISIAVSENENSHLLGIPIPINESCRPMILIGQNHYQLAIPLEIRQGKWPEPVAARTRLGWSLYGKSADMNEENFSVNLHECGCKDTSNELNDLVKGFSSLDTFGTRNETVPESEENKRAMSILEKVQFDGVSYTTGLLWRKDEMVLPESRKMAKRRLECFERKLMKDDNLRQRIDVKFNEYLTKGYARKLSPDEIKPAMNTWYLPVFCVTNPNKPEKVRLVWDAAATSNGMCLNDALMKGPDQLMMLPHVLYKFREGQIGVSADVAEMFHQIKVKNSDQEAQRFLWRNCNTNIEPQEYIMQVQTFGANCSPSVSQYVKNLNSDRFIQQYPRASRAVKENFYVDDYLDSFSTIEEAKEISEQVRFINASGGFQLKDWQSNSRILVDTMQGQPQYSIKEIHEKESQISKVLGMQWCVSSDAFTFRINYSKISNEILNDIRPPTKREVLRVLMCVFDPLGLISSYLILGKILLHDIWSSGIEWDEHVKHPEREKWNNWLKLMTQIEQLMIPRCYTMNAAIKSRQIHMFVDASEQAFAAVCYVRSESEHGVEVRQVGAKTRIAPNKPLSIPRLELMAAVMGSRFLGSVIEGHRIKFDQRFMWTDSKTVLCWINSNARNYKQFVGLRIGEILDLTEQAEWRWVSSKNNVADEATKRTLNPQFISDSRWYNGPGFLYESPSYWNEKKEFTTVLPQDEFRIQIHVVGDNEKLIPKTPDVGRFSSWHKLVRTQATIVRFAKNLKASASAIPRDISPLQADELDLAKNILWRKMQWDCFQTEVIQFHDNRNMEVDKSNELYKYTPFMDDQGVLRMRGRISNIEGVSYDTKYPVIMGKNHRITTLIIEAMHRKFLHRNHEIVISELRNLYVIPHLRRQLQKIRTTCYFCKNRNVKPIPPLMGQLPKSRLSPFIRPFSFVGVDCFGPMEVVNGRKIEKRWGVLYTCLTVRAIHIEIANSLSADSFIMSLKRFMIRRGTPIKITCDNGTNFRGGSQELARELKNIDPIRLQNEFSNIKWEFNPPGAPHFGGAWERMIQCVKSNLVEVLMHRRKPSDELLHTVLIECEGIVNTRPLTHIPLDDAEDEPLTPNHFLVGSSNGTKPLADLRDVDENKLFKKMWITAEQITKRFWRKWMREYLPTLARRTKWFSKPEPIRVGDIVVIAEESQPVRYWPKGKIIEVYEGSDGQVRSAKVKTCYGTYRKPAVKLAVLDVSENKPPQSVIGVENVVEGECVQYGGVCEQSTDITNECNST